MKPLKEKISITVDSDLLVTIRKLAEDDDRSLSQYINLVLKKILRIRSNQQKSLRFFRRDLLLFICCYILRLGPGGVILCAVHGLVGTNSYIILFLSLEL